MTERAAAAVNYTLATHAAEQMKPSQKAIRLCEEIAEGHISGDYAVQQLLLSYGIEFAISIASCWEMSILLPGISAGKTSPKAQQGL